ncbi:MAG TPA: DUF4476 domain-containing protein [Polyangia bacterium]|nr:DUF4476 domain-containing protein [Polyangia bacterium]
MAARFNVIVIATALAATVVASASAQAGPASSAGRRAPRNRTAPRPAPAATPPPVAIAQAPHHPPMEEGAFGALVGSVRGESFSQAQVTVIEQAAARNYFRVAQVKTLIDTVAFSATKLRVLELCAPHIVDGENVFTVFEAFAFSADQEQARQILRRNGF